MKIPGAILVIMSATMLGFKMGECISTRIDNLREIRKMLILIRGEIIYGVTAIDDALENIAGKVSPVFSGFIKAVTVDIRKKKTVTLCEIWSSHIKELRGTYLTKKNLERLKCFGKEFGNMYKDMQVTALDMYIDELEKEIRELDDKRNENLKLYRTLGIMAGIFVAVVLL